MKLLIFIFISVAGFGCQSQKEVSRSENEATKQVTVLFQAITQGQYNEGLLALLKSNDNLNLQDSSVIKLREQFRRINESSGKFIDYRLLKKKSAGNDDVIVCSYLAKYEDRFYRFTFTFYDNGASVKLYKFYFDDNLSVEMEEAIKLYMD
jgi:hypothetical protein